MAIGISSDDLYLGLLSCCRRLRHENPANFLPTEDMALHFWFLVTAAASEIRKSCLVSLLQLLKLIIEKEIAGDAVQA